MKSGFAGKGLAGRLKDYEPKSKDAATGGTHAPEFRVSLPTVFNPASRLILNLVDNRPEATYSRYRSSAVGCVAARAQNRS